MLYAVCWDTSSISVKHRHSGRFARFSACSQQAVSHQHVTQNHKSTAAYKKLGEAPKAMLQYFLATIKQMWLQKMCHLHKVLGFRELCVSGSTWNKEEFLIKTFKWQNTLSFFLLMHLGNDPCLQAVVFLLVTILCWFLVVMHLVKSALSRRVNPEQLNIVSS